MNNGNKVIGVAILALILFGVMMPIAFSAARPEDLYLGNISSPRFLPAAISSGDIVTMSIDVTSTAYSTDMTDVSTILDLSNYFSPVAVSDSVAVIKPQGTNTFLLKYKVNDATPSGFYTIYFNLNYKRDGQPISQKQAINVPVGIDQKNLTIAVNPKTINPGNQSVLDFSITNPSINSVSNVLLSWSEATGLVLPIGSDNKKFIARINPGETVDVNYIVAADPNITTGIYPLNVTITYSDSSGARSQSSHIGLIVGGATDFDVSTEVSTSGQVSFSIANVGSNNAAAVLVKLTRQPGLSITGSDTVIIGSLNKGDYSLANFTVSSSLLDSNNSSGFRRNGLGSNTTPTGFDQNRFDGNGSGQPQFQSSFLVDIYYTDTTGERQHVQKNFSLSTRSSTSSTTSGFGANSARGGQSADFVLIGAIFAVIIIIAAAFNKIKAKISWKNFAIIAVIGVVVPVAIIIFAPSTIITPALAGLFLIGVLVLVFLSRKK